MRHQSALVGHQSLCTAMQGPEGGVVRRRRRQLHTTTNPCIRPDKKQETARAINQYHVSDDAWVLHSSQHIQHQGIIVHVDVPCQEAGYVAVDRDALRSVGIDVLLRDGAPARLRAGAGDGAAGVAHAPEDLEQEHDHRTLQQEVDRADFLEDGGFSPSTADHYVHGPMRDPVQIVIRLRWVGNTINNRPST